MERRPRVCRNEKLLDSGKPERKMPLSTMAKLSGGMKRSSAHSSPAAASGEWWTSPTTSIVLHISSWLSSSFISALHREGEKEGGKERRRRQRKRERGEVFIEGESRGGSLGIVWDILGLRFCFLGCDTFLFWWRRERQLRNETQGAHFVC